MNTKDTQTDFEAAASYAKQALKALRGFERAVEIIEAARAAQGVVDNIGKQIEARNSEIATLSDQLTKLETVVAETEQKHRSRTVALDNTYIDKQAKLEADYTTARDEFDAEEARLETRLKEMTVAHEGRIKQMETDEQKASAALESIRKQVRTARERLEGVAT